MGAVSAQKAIEGSKTRDMMGRTKKNNIPPRLGVTDLFTNSKQEQIVARPGACVLCTQFLSSSYLALSRLPVSDILFAEIPPVVGFVVELLLLSSSESRSSRHSSDSVKKKKRPDHKH